MNTAPVGSTIASQLTLMMSQANPPLSQSELARQSGIPQPTISRLLKGEGGAQVDTLLALAEPLGVTLNDLVYPEGAAVAGEPTAALRPRRRRAEPALTALQQSVLDAFLTLAGSQQISNRECIALLTQWAERLDAADGQEAAGRSHP